MVRIWRAPVLFFILTKLSSKSFRMLRMPISTSIYATKLWISSRQNKSVVRGYEGRELVRVLYGFAGCYLNDERGW